MLVSLTVGKIDAGVCVLLTEDKRLIEFPSILLPPNITSGSVVDVDVSRNLKAEEHNAKAFQSLQSTILTTFGSEEPLAPVLRCRNATQTSIVLEWDPISLAMAQLRSLSLYRNGTKVGNIPKPLEMTSTKISGLAVDTEYNFHLILRTSAGTFSSEKLIVKTHKMTDLSGITVTPGVMAPQLRTSLEGTIEKIGAKLIEQVRIDTTHFVCTEEKGPLYERAKEMNIPIVVPDWIKGCEREGRLVTVRGYYLNADPKLRQVGPSVGLSRETSQQNVQQETPRTSTPERDSTQQPPTTNIIPPTPERRPRRSEEEDEEEEEEEEGDGDENNARDDGDDNDGEGDVAVARQGQNSRDDSSDDEAVHETSIQQNYDHTEVVQEATTKPTAPEISPVSDNGVTHDNMEEPSSEEEQTEIGQSQISAQTTIRTIEKAEKSGEKFDEVDI